MNKTYTHILIVFLISTSMLFGQTYKPYTVHHNPNPSLGNADTAKFSWAVPIDTINMYIDLDTLQAYPDTTVTNTIYAPDSCGVAYLDTIYGCSRLQLSSGVGITFEWDETDSTKQDTAIYADAGQFTIYAVAKDSVDHGSPVGWESTGRVAVYGEANDYGIVGMCSNDYGIYGNASHWYGVYGESAMYGVYGKSTGNYGVYGNSASDYGVYGNSANDYGVYGNARKYAVYGNSANGNYGVYGNAQSYGVYGNSVNDYGVYGVAGTEYGVYGVAGTEYGVYGVAGTEYGGYFEAAINYGIYGTADMDYGVYGNSANGNYGVYGSAPMGNYGGFFTAGNYAVAGSTDADTDTCFWAKRGVSVFAHQIYGNLTGALTGLADSATYAYDADPTGTNLAAKFGAYADTSVVYDTLTAYVDRAAIHDSLDIVRGNAADTALTVLNRRVWAGSGVWPGNTDVLAIYTPGSSVNAIPIVQFLECDSLPSFVYSYSVVADSFYITVCDSAKTTGITYYWHLIEKNP